MTLRTPVPSDVEATSWTELALDCHRLRRDRLQAGTGAVTRPAPMSVLAAAAPVLALTLIPLARLPYTGGSLPVELTEDLLVSVAGYSDYGS